METELAQPKTRRESEVWKACDDLWAQSASVRTLTGDNIRDQLLRLGYKRGSPNEIYRYRNSWKDSRGISDQDSSTQDQIKASDPISRAVSLVYDQMRSQAADTLEQLKEDYETRLGEAQSKLESLQASVSQYEAEKKELGERVAEFEEAIAVLNAENDELKKKAFVLNEKLQNALNKEEAISREQQNLVLELKTFHDREIDLWRGQVKERDDALTRQRKEAKEELERQGAQFSEELMSLKTLLRQTVEEKEFLKAKSAAMEDTLKDARGFTKLASHIQNELQSLVAIAKGSKSRDLRMMTCTRELLAASNTMRKRKARKR